MLVFTISETVGRGFSFDLFDNEDEQEVLLFSDFHPCIEYCIADIRYLIKKFMGNWGADELPDESESEFSICGEGGREIARSVIAMSKRERRRFVGWLRSNVGNARIEISNDVNRLVL